MAVTTTTAPSKEKPFKTIQKALSVARAGDTIYVRAGVYSEEVHVKQSGAANKPIRIEGYQNERPIVDGKYRIPQGDPVRCDNKTGEQRCFHYGSLVWLEGSYIHFSGFEVRYSPGRGMLVGGASQKTRNVVVDDVLIHDNRFSGMKIMNADHIEFSNSHVFRSVDYAPYPRSAGDTNWTAAVALRTTDHVLIKGNHIYNNWGEGFNSDIKTTNTVVEDNVVFDNLALQVYAHRVQNMDIQRNLIYHTNDPDFQRFGNPSDCIVLNNEARFSANGTVKNVNIRNKRDRRL